MEMQHRMTSALSSVKGGKEKAPRIAAEVKKERRKMSSRKPSWGEWSLELLQSRVGQARFEWSKVRRRLDSFHSMIAGTPPEVGTNEARLANPGPEFHWYNLLLLATRLAVAPSCNDQISSVSGPMPESAPISPCIEDSFVSITDPHPRLGPPVRRSGVLPLQTLRPGTMALFSALLVQAPRFIVTPPPPLVRVPCLQQ